MINNLIRHVKMKGIRDHHAAETIAHDVLLDKNSRGSEFKNANFRILNYIRDTKRWEERTITLESKSDEDSSLLELLPYDDFNEKQTALQESQRQLINDLVDGSDERTTLIVQTFLTTDKPTITNVAKELNLHHQVVSRCLKRMAKKYSEDSHGKLEDYLIA